jgi:hypothetical protein
MGTRDTTESGARFTPPPFAVVVSCKEKRVVLGIQAKSGFHLWNFCSFMTREDGVEIRVDLEGHSDPGKVIEEVWVVLIRGEENENPMTLVSRCMKKCYPSAFHSQSVRNPDWWYRPIYCGWGDQVGISLYLEGKGQEWRALAYNTQGLYERWINRLEEAGVPIGTITIDAGWSPAGVWEPYKFHWPDLRGFIERQHRKSRKVILWIATWLCEGLPDKWCVRIGKKQLVADPEQSGYRMFLRKQTARLLSSGKDGFNADGFKIDQLGFTPTERSPLSRDESFNAKIFDDKHPRLVHAGKRWGCELLHFLQKEIYTAAKNVKPDALITSSTVHPYFHDTFDMVRLHDVGLVEGDVVAAMKARADLARAVLPGHPIDSDDWVAFDYAKWMHYTIENCQLGVPCTLYAEYFVESFEKEPGAKIIPLKDMRKIAAAWKKYLS